jgi:alkyldihydroxyacetonephosphate synthase
MAWDAWGDPALAKPLPAAIRSLLEQALGVSGVEVQSPGPDEVQLSPSALAPVHRDALAAVVGEDFLRTGNGDRLPYAGGKSTPDLLRRKQMQQDAPDAVILPGSEDEVAAVLAYCSAHRIAVVPFGGGTSVVGGLDPIRRHARPAPLGRPALA